MYCTPAALQSSISFFRIGRDASETSVSPRQNFLKPPPVPEMPTVTLTLPLVDFWKSSAMASVIGNTVLEPSIFTNCACATGAAMHRVPANAAVNAANAMRGSLNMGSISFGGGLNLNAVILWTQCDSLIASPARDRPEFSDACSLANGLRQRLRQFGNETVAFALHHDPD